MMSSRNLVMASVLGGLLAGVIAGRALAHRQRQRERRRSAVLAQALQVWEDEGGAVPVATTRPSTQTLGEAGNAGDTGNLTADRSTSSPSGLRSSAPWSAGPGDRRSRPPPEDFPPVPSPS